MPQLVCTFWNRFEIFLRYDHASRVTLQWQRIFKMCCFIEHTRYAA